jgi:hypothetical protein
MHPHPLGHRIFVGDRLHPLGSNSSKFEQDSAKPARQENRGHTAVIILLPAKRRSSIILLDSPIITNVVSSHFSAFARRPVPIARIIGLRRVKAVMFPTPIVIPAFANPQPVSRHAIRAEARQRVLGVEGLPAPFVRPGGCGLDVRPSTQRWPAHSLARLGKVSSTGPLPGAIAAGVIDQHRLRLYWPPSLSLRSK